MNQPMMRRILLAAIAASPAWADAPPSMTPTRDVDVDYAMAGGLRQHMQWDVANQLLRVDPPGGGLYMLVDYRRDRMLLVSPARHSFTQVAGAAPLPTPGSDTKWQRGTSETVAGLPCTNWLTRDTTGNQVALCLTTDGVLLRARAPTGILVQAEQVTYRAADPLAFKVPPDYQISGVNTGTP